MSGISFFRARTSARPVLVWLVALAFALQSFIVQTHIHPMPAGTAAAIGQVFVHSPAQKQAPADNNPANCPFCQAVTHAGAFFVAAAPVMLLAAIWARCAAPSLALFAIERSSPRNGLSRAPPAH